MVVCRFQLGSIESLHAQRDRELQRELGAVNLEEIDVSHVESPLVVLFE
jgi:hypothetical protein